MEERKREKRTLIEIEILLILLVILIFIVIRCLGLIEHKSLVPTGNIDIFDIIFLPTTSAEEDATSNGKQDGKQDGKAPIYKEDRKEDVSVFDAEGVYSDGVYTDIRKLNIFTQTTYYIVNNKIAPTSENAYQFVIRNNSTFAINYDLIMLEDNPYDINMKYRLKLNGKYIIGNANKYVTANELERFNLKLNRNKYDTYTLEWKWFESDNDTKIGKSIDANYQLNIKIAATEY